MCFHGLEGRSVPLICHLAPCLILLSVLYYKSFLGGDFTTDVDGSSAILDRHCTYWSLSSLMKAQFCLGV